MGIGSQKCKCYRNGGDDIVQCQEDHAEIKQGYWYGLIITGHTVSLCPINYCDFNHHLKTRSDYYILQGAVDDQCRSHRTGVVCSDCKPGFNQCSPGMTVLVILFLLDYNSYSFIYIVMLF